MVNGILYRRSQFKACFLLACALHILAFFWIHWTFIKEKSAPKKNLDLILIASKSIKPVEDPIHEKEPERHLRNHQNKSSTESVVKHSVKSNRSTLKRRTISANNHKPEDANYLARWQAYMEEFGNKHYPQEALKHNIRGSLRLMVALKKDGSIYEINLRSSSGSKVLDEAAIRLVQKAAPFEPLPQEVSKDIEILEIMRTWQFRGTFSSQG